MEGQWKRRVCTPVLRTYGTFLSLAFRTLPWLRHAKPNSSQSPHLPSKARTSWRCRGDGERRGADEEGDPEAIDWMEKAENCSRAGWNSIRSSILQVNPPAHRFSFLCLFTSSLPLPSLAPTTRSENPFGFAVQPTCCFSDFDATLPAGRLCKIGLEAGR